MTKALLFTLSFLTVGLAQAQELKDYTAKTYLYLNNSFEEKYQSKVDTQNYTLETQFRDNRIVSVYYPQYGSEFISRTEIYQYTESGQLSMLIKIHKTRNDEEQLIDSIRYDYHPADEKYDLIVSASGDLANQERHIIHGDTTFIENYINGQYEFSVREIQVSKNVKVSQIIAPEASEIINTIYFDEFGNEILYKQTEKGITNVRTQIEYEFDEFSRITRKNSFFGPQHELGCTEIIIYE